MDGFRPSDLQGLVLAILTSAQFRAIAALVLLDVVLGVARSLRLGSFDLAAVGRFYGSMVLPYLLGYVALAVAVHYVLPADMQSVLDPVLGPMGLDSAAALVGLAWVAVVATLGKSVWDNGRVLYESFLPGRPSQAE